ncbi:MAG: hypothetical protein GDA56_07985 [Hormoscilla sp. GM7CHS1pb]|nr:hypothetical protein [Hormoscilla sp. GM7CHS1pb]
MHGIVNGRVSMRKSDRQESEADFPVRGSVNVPLRFISRSETLFLD